MTSIHPNENSYVSDQESAAEMARLLDQDILVTKHMGGLFPADIDLSSIQDVLDIACGPGGWVQEVAFKYPEMQVTGIDISANMLSYARAQAAIQGLNNARFLPMDATSPLDFPDNSFDMVNARFLLGFMWKEAWPKLVAECVRVTRPGGIIRLTETDLKAAISTSRGLEKITTLLTQAFHRTGRSFHPDENGGYCVLYPMLRFFLEQAGCHTIREQAHVINCSAGTASYAGVIKDWQVGMKLVQPFLVKLGLTTRQDLDEIYQQMLDELVQEDFRGVWLFMSAYGQTPV